MRAGIVLVVVTSMLAVAGLVLGSSAAQAQADGEWVRGPAQIAESATSGSIERISVSGSSISVQMTGPLGSNALAQYDLKWDEPPTVLKPGQKFPVEASMAAYMVSEGVAQSYSEEAFIIRASGKEVLRLWASQGCGGTGAIVCSKPVSLPVKGTIVAPLSGQTFVVEALTGRCSCKVTWTYEWQQSAIAAPPPSPLTTTTVAATTAAPTTAAPAAPATAATQPSAAAVPEPTPTSEPSIAAAPGSATASSTTPAGDDPPATTLPAPESQPGTPQIAVPVSSASGEPLITDEEAIAASIAGVFIALIISGLTLAEAGLRLTDLFGESGREVAESFGAFDDGAASATATAPSFVASPGPREAQNAGAVPWYQEGNGEPPQASWYQEPSNDSGGPEAPVSETGIEDDVVDWLEDTPITPSDGPAPDIPVGPNSRAVDTDFDGIYDEMEVDTNGDGTFDQSAPLTDAQRADLYAGALGEDEGPGESAESEEQETESPEVPPVEPDWVSRQEIDDIYERGLASGRSLDDLREDVAGLSQARGGPAEVPDPYEFQMSATDVGPVPLTPGELDDYRAAQQELRRYMAERDRLHRSWDEYLSDRKRWRGRNRVRSAIDVWNTETRYREREQLNDEWRYAWSQWLDGNRYYVGPEGSDYLNTFGHIQDPFFDGDPKEYARDEIARLRRLRNSNEASRMRYMAAARFRPSAAEDGARLDEVQQGIIDRNRIISGPINAARERMNRIHSYVNGRPLPDRPWPGR